MKKFLAGFFSCLAFMGWVGLCDAALKGAGTNVGAAVGTLPIANGGTGAVTNRAAASGLSVPYILAKSFVIVAAPADTTEDILATVNIPAAAMGANGSIRFRAAVTATNGAGTKAFRVRFSGIGGTIYHTSTITTQTPMLIDVIIGNRNSASSQGGANLGVLGSAALVVPVVSTSTENTALATTLVLTAQKNTGGDTAQVEWYICELLSDGT